MARPTRIEPGLASRGDRPFVVVTALAEGTFDLLTQSPAPSREYAWRCGLAFEVEDGRVLLFT
jgi:hypothetical protein